MIIFQVYNTVLDGLEILMDECQDHEEKIWCELYTSNSRGFLIFQDLKVSKSHSQMSQFHLEVADYSLEYVILILPSHSRQWATTWRIDGLV